MKSFKPIVVALFALLGMFAFSCKKDQKGTAYGTDILSYSVEKGSVTNIIKPQRQVVISIGDDVDRTKLQGIFDLSPGAVAKVNGVVQKSSSVIDLSSPLTYTVEAPDGSSSNWEVSLKPNTFEIGLGRETTAQRHNEPVYDWYINQDNTGKYAYTNGGSAAICMAAYWADPILSLNTEIIREELDQYRINNSPPGEPPPPRGSAFKVFDITGYLTKYSIPWKIIALPDKYQTIKNVLDKGYIMILCIDMKYISYDFDQYHHTERFYPTALSGGHFVIVKGYRETDGNNYWLETFDPFNRGFAYTNNGGSKGKNRYYSSITMEDATNRWWDYAIVIGKRYGIMEKLDTEVKAATVYNSGGY